MKALFSIIFFVLVGLAFGLMPRGKENTTVYNNCTDQVCALWSATSTDIYYQGVPFKTVNIFEDNSHDSDIKSMNKNNRILTSLNFFTGVMVGAIIIRLIKANYKKK